MKPHRKSSIPHPVRPPKRKQIDPIQQRMALTRAESLDWRDDFADDFEEYVMGWEDYGYSPHRPSMPRGLTVQDTVEIEWREEWMTSRLSQEVRRRKEAEKLCAALLDRNEDMYNKSRTPEDDMRVARAIVPLPGIGVAVRGKRVRPE